MPRKEEIKRPPDCPTCPKYKTCRTLCAPVARWVAAAETPVDRKLVSSSSVGRPSPGGSEEYFERRPFMDSAMFNVAALGLNSTWSAASEEDRWAAWEELRSLRLTRNMETVAWLYYMEGMRVRDIAIQLGISSKAVDKRRKILREHVGSRMARRMAWSALQAYLCSTHNMIAPHHDIAAEVKFIVAKKYFDEMLSYRDICRETLVCVDEVLEIVKDCLSVVELITGEDVLDTSTKYRRCKISTKEHSYVVDPDGDTA